MDTSDTVKSNGLLKFDLRRMIFYAISLGFIVVIYLKWGEVHELKEIFDKSDISWVLVALFFQVLTYYFIALNYHYIFRLKGHQVSVSSLFPLSLITQFLNQAFPSAGISGQVFLIDYLRKRGATIVDGVSRAILEIASLFCGFGIMFILASILYLTGGAFRMHPNLIYLVYIFWFLAAISLSAFLLIQRANNGGLHFRLFEYFKGKENLESNDGPKKNNKIKTYVGMITEQIKESMDVAVLKKNKTLFPAAVYCQVTIFMIDALTLYALAIALDIHLSFVLILIIFTFTQFISMISFVPGSLLVYEGGMSIMLIAFGVPHGSALTLALLFRTLIFWLPMPIGWLLYRQHEKSHRKQQSHAVAS